MLCLVCWRVVSFPFAPWYIFDCVKTRCEAWERHGLRDIVTVTKGRLLFVGTQLYWSHYLLIIVPCQLTNHILAHVQFKFKHFSHEQCQFEYKYWNLLLTEGYHMASETLSRLQCTFSMYLTCSLSLYGKQEHKDFILLCLTKERKSYRFGTT